MDDGKMTVASGKPAEPEYGTAFEGIDDAPISAVDITNDFMFSFVMNKPDICMELLRFLLPDINIAKIKYHREEDDDLNGETVRVRNKPETQKVLQEAVNKRGVRLDVYLDDGETVYDVEMQTTADKHLAKRARYYQSRIDADQLDRGSQFDELKPCYVIFICKFDPFKLNLYQYKFVNRCEEEPGLELCDGATKLFFNTAGTKGEINERLKELLTYMNDTKSYPVDKSNIGLIDKIEHAVGMAKKSSDWRRSYMMYQERQRTAELRGIEIGKAQGKESGIAEGMEIGWAKGDKQRQTDMVRGMLAEKIPVDIIMRVSGLKLSEIKELEKQTMN